MTERRYDVIVIGSGNAGLAAAGAVRKAGKSVVVVEGRDVGGTCALRGCVPKKVLVAAAEVLDQIDRAGAHHIRVGDVQLDWKALIERERTFVDGVPGEFEASLERRGIDLVRGRARFAGAQEIEVGGERFRGEQIVVATGSKPRPLPIDGFEQVVSSDELLERDELPESLVFIGAGVIAFEFAHVFARAGTRVTMLEAAPAPLGNFDADAVDRLVAYTRELGVEITTDVKVERIDSVAGVVPRVVYRVDGEEHALDAEVVANGAGRVADLDALGLGAAGIHVERGRVELDEQLRSIDNAKVFFAGDAITGAPQLSPVATYEGRIVGHNLTSDEPRTPEYGAIPAVVHTVPALATVGLTEEQASTRGLDFDARTNEMESWRSARTFAERVAFAKVLVERGSERILGAHLVGHGAAETVQTFALAIEFGWTAPDLAERVYAYPTFNADVKFMVT